MVSDSASFSVEPFSDWVWSESGRTEITVSFTLIIMESLPVWADALNGRKDSSIMSVNRCIFCEQTTVNREMCIYFRYVLASQNAKLRKNESNTKKEQSFFFVLPSESNFGEATVTIKKDEKRVFGLFFGSGKAKMGLKNCFCC